MDREHGVVAVVLAAERERDLELVEAGLEPRELPLDVGLEGGAFLLRRLRGKGGQFLEVGGAPLEVAPGLDLPLDAGDALEQLLRALGFVPEVGVGGLGAEPG